MNETCTYRFPGCLCGNFKPRVKMLEEYEEHIFVMRTY